MRKTAVAIVLALVLAACGDTTDPVPATDPPGTTAPTTTTAPEPTTTTTAPTTTTTTTAPATTTTTVPPDGPPPFDTWVAIVASLPSADHDRDAAETVAAGFDLVELDVLLSDDYPSLNPGFWVVYTRPYEFSWQAVEACAGLAGEIPDCYARYLGTDPAQPVGQAEGTALAMTDDYRLAVIDTATGELIRTVRPSFGGDGSFPGRPALSADGLSIDYSVGSEDFWFSCEASDGHMEQMDLVTGRAAKAGDGFAPVVSPDGTTLAYLASSQCFPDPAEPSFVLAPADTIVLRDIATGRESKQTVPLTGNPEEGFELWNVAWAGSDLFVLDTFGGVSRFVDGDPTSPGSGPFADLVAAGLDAGGHGLVGFSTALDRLLVTYTYFDTDAQFTELHAVHPASGALELLGVYEDPVAVALDRTGAHLLIAAAGRLEADGREVDLGANVVMLAW